MPKLPQVKCPICGQYFSRSEAPFIHLKNRYYHQSCYDARENEKSEEEREKEKLVEYIKKLFGIPTLTVKINKQLKDYIEVKNYSYEGIRKTLIYWFELKGNSIEKANGGIGIVPYCYEQALAYWKTINEAREYNEQAQKIQATIETRVVHIAPPERKPMRIIRNLFAFLEEEGDTP